MLNVRGADSAAALTPVRLLGSVSFLYFRHRDVYILFVTKQNANAMLAMSFMKQVLLRDAFDCGIAHSQQNITGIARLQQLMCCTVRSWWCCSSPISRNFRRQPSRTILF